MLQRTRDLKIKDHWITMRSHQAATHNPYFQSKDFLKLQFFEAMFFLNTFKQKEGKKLFTSSILSKPKWGAQAVVKDAPPPEVTAQI